MTRFKRIEFGFEEKSSFFAARNLREKILDIKQILRRTGVKEMWFFLEPQVELTWKSSRPHEKDMLLVQNYLETRGLSYKCYSFGGTSGIDWLGATEGERELGVQLKMHCSNIAEDLLKYYPKLSLSEALGKGEVMERQIQRNIHRMCNPSGISNWREARICFRQAFTCLSTATKSKLLKKFYRWLGRKI